MEHFFQWLHETPFATAIREGSTLFPNIESIHVLAITLVVGTISVVDLRLIGVLWRNRKISQLMTETLPLTWGAFAVAVITGTLLFSSNDLKYTHNPYFLSKMVLLAVAGLNMLAFHFITSRDIATWDDAAKPPSRVRLAGAVSLLLWVGVISTGRIIGFTMSAF